MNLTFFNTERSVQNNYYILTNNPKQLDQAHMQMTIQ